MLSPTHNTIFHIKCLMGQTYNNEGAHQDLNQDWPFTPVVNGPREKPLIDTWYMGELKRFTPWEISSMILSKMKETAETYLGKEVKNAVISVPHNFTDSQRQILEQYLGLIFFALSTSQLPPLLLTVYKPRK